jgi:hypothetical protein
MNFWLKISNHTHEKCMNGCFFAVGYSCGCMNFLSDMISDQFFSSFGTILHEKNP